MGVEHTNVAENYFSLGEVYYLLNKYNDAIECLQISKEINQKIFGEKHKNLKVIYKYLSKCYKELD